MPTKNIAGLGHRSEEVVAFVDRVTKECRSYEGPERRMANRQAIAVAVAVQPLDSEFELDGESFTAVTTNISGGGIGFVHRIPVCSPYVQLTLSLESGETFELLAAVRHCSPKADLYEIGGRFVVDWGEVER